MITVTRICDVGQSGWADLPEPMVFESAKTAREYFQVTQGRRVMLYSIEAPEGKTRYRCRNCGKVYTLKSGALIPSDEPGGVDAWPTCCWEFDRESGEMVLRTPIVRCWQSDMRT